MFRWMKGLGDDGRDMSDVYEEPILSFVAGIQKKARVKYIGKKCCSRDCGNIVKTIPDYHMMECLECTKCKGVICPDCPLHHCRRCGKVLCEDCETSNSFDFERCAVRDCWNAFCADCIHVLYAECDYGDCACDPACCNEKITMTCDTCGRRMCGDCFNSIDGCISCNRCGKDFCHSCGYLRGGLCEDCSEEVGDY